ncbi:MAG TPA: hypothetical protein VLS89_09830, partial [Candidatus Nanopelagicales bacterium]|nr:hypothetical protein [Candidatus Nanopelagicales bacterium]
RELIDAYGDACRGTVWLVGGHGAEGLRPFIEARGGMVAGELTELRSMVEKALMAQRRARKDKDEAR